MRRTLLTSLGVTALALAVYYIMLMLLDRTDLMPRLLSPTRDGFVPVALLGLSFFVLRLTLLLVLPGALLTRLVLALSARGVKRR